ncbi:hypothetical protein [Microbacterium sp. TNHR37B]|uniref:hypothetical protein n=1 Tax=Microbacterium sp. TNHR37B TaxID=1775956 RepID=UPI0007B1B963|nr:hypothetical protein [Microbacterium sp. TNHR37B]KZE88609.1 hypothetical protein AVP41_03115 [Microbacterium sp. TNHR37B]
MKDILIDGQRLLTTDAVADAVIDYARVLHMAGEFDVVDFPGIHDGELSTCSLLLGTAGSLVVVNAQMELTFALPESDVACAEIARRADALR